MKDGCMRRQPDRIGGRRRAGCRGLKHIQPFVKVGMAVSK
jgi:hypothetical protein